MGELHPIIVLWAVPRSTSTAFEMAMRQRGDMTCFHEPFGAVWHCGEEEDSSCPENHRYEKRPGLTLQSQLEKILGAARDAPVFVKDFAHHVKPLLQRNRNTGTDMDILCPLHLPKFTHSFLIRNPAKALPSLHKQWPDFNLEEAGFEDQRTLFDTVREYDHNDVPTVVDSDDLLANPDKIMQKFCERMGLKHMPEALSWEPGNNNNNNINNQLKTDWYDGKAWHESLEKSTGFSKKNSTSHKISVHDDPVLEQKYQACLPHYEYLNQHRILLE